MRITGSFYSILLLTLCSLSLVYYTDAALAAMSIDFGSQYLKIALVKPGVPMEIVLNKESRRKTPNLVGFKNTERFFSDAALAFALKNPQNSLVHLVDLLGKQADNPLVALYKQRFPFVKVIPDEERGTVQFAVDDEVYSVEALVAMILSHARKLAEHYAEQPVKNVVITIPPFFNQAERRAVTKAAEIAGLNLLQLMNDHSAAGLSYGIFRRKEITDQAQTLLIYDMGATKTTASILEYRLEKDKKGSEKNPVMSTLGLGYDRTLGGLEISLRLRDHLVAEYNKQTKKDISKVPRSMAKMFKEAERVKQVLSANADHYAQVESVYEDRDFKARVTRVELEDMIKDLEPRVVQPIKDALQMAEMTVEQIDQVVLMGAGTRVPKIQELVREFFKGKELSKFLNTDESIAMGAVYQAAHLSKGFKVKQFGVRDLQIFPIQVDFVSPAKKDGSKGERVVHRPIFGYKSYFPSSKKILSFSSFTKDFTFNVNYGELKHLTGKQLSEFGSLNISDVDLVGITKAYDSEMATEGSVYKGVKAHFNMDESGVVHIDNAEVYVEKPLKEESAFASLAGKITGLFSSGGAKEEAKEDKEKQDVSESDEKKVEEGKDAKPSEEKKPGSDGTEKDTQKPNDTDAKKEKSEDEKKKNETDVEKKEDKPKVTKVVLEVKEKRLDLTDVSSSETVSAKKRLKKFSDIEKKKAEREEAHNLLESLVYDVTDKLEQPELKVFMKSDEREAIEKEAARIRAWLEDDVGIETTTEEFVSNRKAIEKLLKPINFRVNEYKNRPAIIADLLSLFNHSEIFVTLGKNLTEAGIFTEVELTTLEKALNETQAWWVEKNASQVVLKPTDEPAYTIEDLKDKIRNLDREVRYLVNKMKYAKPKVKKEEKDANETKTAEGNETVAEAAGPETENDIKPEETQAPTPETSEKTEEDWLQLEGMAQESEKERERKEREKVHDEEL